MRVNITKYEGNSSLGPAGFWIAFATLESKNAKMREFGREIGFGTLDSLRSSWRRTHLVIIATNSC